MKKLNALRGGARILIKGKSTKAVKMRLRKSTNDIF
jgi:hypothetical protein